MIDTVLAYPDLGFAAFAILFAAVLAFPAISFILKLRRR